MEHHSFSHNTTEADQLHDEVVGLDHKVPLLDGSAHVYTNLDNAASTPPLRCVKEKVDEAMEWYSSVHRGTGFKSMLSTYLYDQAREVVAEFVGADSEHDVVIFGKNSSGQLGNGTTTPRGDTPGKINIGKTKMVSAGGAHTLALLN